MPRGLIRHFENWRSKSNAIEVEAEGHGIYHSIRPTIILAKCFGLSPLSKAFASDAVEFRWLSASTAYSCFIFGLISTNAILAIVNFISTPSTSFTVGKIAGLLHNPFFYSSAALSFILTFNFTRKLPVILRQWDETVNRLRKYSQPSTRSIFSKWTTSSSNCQMSVQWSVLITAIMVTTGVTEHALHDATEFNKKHCQTYACPEKSYILCCLNPMNNFVSNILGPKPLAVVIAYVTQKFATFSWNYHDLLLIQISSALTVNFKVLAEYVKRVTKNRESMTDVDWKQLREDHVALCELVHTLDDALSPIVLFSYVVNVYFVAIQIFFGVHLENRGWVEIGYIVMSFTHIIGRMIVVTATASNFYDQAYEPLYYLLHLPTEIYNTEIRRISDHLSICTIGLTGWKMFVINRRIFLAIISLIFTYELLLLNVE